MISHRFDFLIFSPMIDGSSHCSSVTNFSWKKNNNKKTKHFFTYDIWNLHMHIINYDRSIL